MFQILNDTAIINGTYALLGLDTIFSVAQWIIGLMGGVIGIYVFLTILKWYEFKKLKYTIKELRDEIEILKESIQELHDHECRNIKNKKR